MLRHAEETSRIEEQTLPNTKTLIRGFPIKAFGNDNIEKTTPDKASGLAGQIRWFPASVACRVPADAVRPQ